MIYTRNGSEALESLFVHKSVGDGREHWAAKYFGPRTSRSDAPGPQATLSDMGPNETIFPHFHPATQFQLFPAGSGMIGKGKTPIVPLTVQYKDRHTAYGPVVSGPNGLCFMALRIKTTDSAPVYLSNPGYRERLKPSKRRNWLSSPVGFSTPPGLQHRKEAAWEPLFDTNKIEDEMAAHLLRLGAGMVMKGPDPKAGGGYYIFVANGSMEKDGQDLPLWSMVVVESNEDGFEIRAGKKGLEALVLQFPREED
jgi:hypothetical protein